MVRSEIKYTDTSTFHMLRHFELLPSTIKEKLLLAGFSLSQIDENLQVTGSRFDTYFASTIDELLNRLFTESTYTEKAGLNGNHVVHAIVSVDKYPNGLGTCGVVRLETISSSLLGKIYAKKNRGIELKHIDVEELPRTTEFTVILKPTNHHFLFISAFPGPPAMPLPDHNMPKALYQVCSDYWEKHVFLNLRAAK